jgi:hypothetical protein
MKVTKIIGLQIMGCSFALLFSSVAGYRLALISMQALNSNGAKYVNDWIDNRTLIYLTPSLTVLTIGWCIWAWNIRENLHLFSRRMAALNTLHVLVLASIYTKAVYPVWRRMAESIHNF